ncbi:hypothetical protein C7B76_22455 [filamentous cyanobacterium CCP2]|nr:hypothetical protein C7B76_22455 [filamentous cyanobacterium CCP2]
MQLQKTIAEQFPFLSADWATAYQNAPLNDDSTRLEWDEPTEGAGRSPTDDRCCESVYDEVDGLAEWTSGGRRCGQGQHDWRLGEIGQTLME